MANTGSAPVEGKAAAMEDQKTSTTEIPPARPRAGRGRWLLAGVLVLVAAAGLFYWRHTAGLESTDDAQIDGRIHTVSARVAGTVVRILVEDNQYVEAGTVLVEIDPRDYEIAVAQAKADLAEAEADLRESQSEVPIVSRTSTNQSSSAQATVDEAKASMATAQQQVAMAEARLRAADAMSRQARASHETASRDLVRYRTLIAKEEISRQQFDTAVSAENSSEARVDAAQAQLDEARQGVEVARSQFEQQRARLSKVEADARGAQTAPQQVAASRAREQSAAATVQRKKADLEAAELNLQYATMKALVSGIASQRGVEVGQMVQAGQPLLAIVPLDEIWVTANFKESQLANMHPAQPVDVAVDAYGGKTYKGHVDSISAATGARFSLLPPENASGNYVKVVQRIPVKIVLEKGQDSEHLLRPGMSVVPTVNTR